MGEGKLGSLRRQRHMVIGLTSPNILRRTGVVTQTGIPCFVAWVTVFVRSLISSLNGERLPSPALRFVMLRLAIP